LILAAPAAIAAKDVDKEFKDNNNDDQIDDPVEISPTAAVITAASAVIEH